MNTNSENELSPLERDLLTRFQVRYEKHGFVPVDDISVIRRENTGVGRSTYLSHDRPVPISDGQLFLGNRSHLELEDVEGGATFCVSILENKLVSLEIFSNGALAWDGVEHIWVVHDPDADKTPDQLTTYEDSEEFLHATLMNVRDEASFLAFIKTLCEDRMDDRQKEMLKPSSPYGPSANGWENGTIEAFLEAAYACGIRWIDEANVDDEPDNDWFRAARIIYCGKSYE